MKSHWPKTIIPGLLLGFTVASLGFADYDELHRMLLFRDLRLLFAFAFAVSLCVILFASLRSRLKLGPVRFHSGTVPGAVLFGVGWALTGACPGVAVIQIAQGLWPAWASFGGILVGIWMHGRLLRRPASATGQC